MEVHVPELLEVRPNDLVGIDVNDFLDVDREKDVKEKDLIAKTTSDITKRAMTGLGA